MDDYKALFEVYENNKSISYENNPYLKTISDDIYRTYSYHLYFQKGSSGFSNQ